MCMVQLFFLITMIRKSFAYSRKNSNAEERGSRDRSKLARLPQMLARPLAKTQRRTTPTQYVQLASSMGLAQMWIVSRACSMESRDEKLLFQLPACTAQEHLCLGLKPDWIQTDTSDPALCPISHIFLSDLIRIIRILISISYTYQKSVF
jgi:hypothetical protein